MLQLISDPTPCERATEQIVVLFTDYIGYFINYCFILLDRVLVVLGWMVLVQLYVCPYIEYRALGWKALYLCSVVQHSIGWCRVIVSVFEGIWQ